MGQLSVTTSDNDRRLLLALLDTHFGAIQDTGESENSVRGMPKGLTFLLHGPAGMGKSFAVGTSARSVKAPLVLRGNFA
jgi:hypothetical protein